MNKVNFLNRVLDVIVMAVLSSLAWTTYEGESFYSFLALTTVLVLFILTTWIISEKTLGKVRDGEGFNKHVRLIYSSNLSELINDFATCDVFFKRQIGGCYTFSSKRRFWHNQAFFVEKIQGSLRIVCDQYSFRQLKLHPVSFVFNGKICCQERKSNKDNKPIIFN